MWATNTLPLYNCTEGSPSPYRQSHVVRFRSRTCEKYRNVPLHYICIVTNFDGRQHTVFDVQASKRLFYTYNTVVLFINIIIIIIAVGVSAHAVAGSLAWIRMRHATCTR